MNSQNTKVGNRAQSGLLGSDPQKKGAGEQRVSRTDKASSTCLRCSARSCAEFALRYMHPCTGTMYWSCTRVASALLARSRGVSSLSDGPDDSYLSRR